MGLIACVDSDVLIDYFDGIQAAAEELSRYDGLVVSRIAWIEVLVGAPAAKPRKAREDFLDQFPIFELDSRVAREAVALRQEHRLKLPDAIIWATARLTDTLLVTRNAKDFPVNDPGIRLPYRI